MNNILSLITTNKLCIEWCPKVLYLRIPSEHVSITHKQATIKLKGKTEEEALKEGLKLLGLED